MIHLALSAVARSDANDGGLVDVVALGATRGTDACSMWIHDCQLEVSVAQASPAPVDVVVVAHLIAVAHKRVSAAATCTAVVNHGAASNELLVNHVFPRLLVIVAAINELSIIVKVIIKCFRNIGIGGARSGEGVGHVGSMSHIEHESCNGVGVNLVLAAVVAIEHVCPVKSGDGQIFGGLGDILSHVSCSVTILVARNHLSCLCGIIVVFHYLRHGGCHAASVGGLILAVLVLHLWTLVPVGACLVPLGGEQWSYRVAGVNHILALGSG